MKKYLYLEVKIAYVKPFEIVNTCVCCSGTNFIVEGRDHPMNGWVQCTDCQLWYHEDIVFDIKKEK